MNGIHRIGLTALFLAILGTLGYAGATYYSNLAVTQQVTVKSSCILTTPTTNINFGSLDQNTNTGSSMPNSIVFTNTGNSNSDLYLYEYSSTGYNGWNGITTPAQGFYEANAVFSSAGATSYASGTRITGTSGSPQDTSISCTSGGSTCTLYLGLGIPQYQGAQSYNTVLTIVSTC